MTRGLIQACNSALEGTNPWLSQTAVIQEIRAELKDVATYYLSLRDEARSSQYRFQPGQFNMLYLPGAGEIAISLSADPRSSGRWAHTVRVVGNVTKTLARLQPGDTLGLRGPYGTSWPLEECVGKDVLVVAGGIGLAPLRPAIYSFLHDRSQFGKIKLLYGARSPSQLLYESQYMDWTQQGIGVEVTVDRAEPGWRGNIGVVTTLIEQLQDFHADRTVVLGCGPEVMMHFAAKSVLAGGVSANRIWVSLERNMQCAVGLCGHCQLGPEFICKDGPVFRYDRVAPWVMVKDF